jgi:anti-sigma B factor antagonist
MPEEVMAIDQQPYTDVERRTFGTTAEVEVRGELDLASTPDFERSVRSALTDRPERILIDLRQVTFIDSTAVHALLRLRDRAAEREVDLLVLRPAGESDRIFEVCGIGAVFPKLDGT